MVKMSDQHYGWIVGARVFRSLTKTYFAILSEGEYRVAPNSGLWFVKVRDFNGHDFETYPLIGDEVLP